MPDSRRRQSAQNMSVEPNQCVPEPQYCEDPQMSYGNAFVQDLLNEGHEELDDLVDLTPTQARWIRVLRQLELLNPRATVQDLSMALSLEIWNAGQMWDESGKSSYPGLILDYEGGDGHRSVDFGRGDDRIGREDLLGWAEDKHGERSNVNHAFPAVAAQAGRGWLGREYGSFMATSGGDTLQNTGALLVEQENNFSAGEYSGNMRAETIADEVRERGGSLSDAMLEQFRRENRSE